MKWRQIVIGILVLSFAASLFAETTTAHTGGNFGKVNLEAIDGTGLIKLSGTTVAGDVHATGSVIAQNSQIGSFDVIGEINLTETTVNLGSQIIGSIQTTRSTFKKPIVILSQKAIFTTSKLQGIVVKKDGGYKGKQIIELRQGTLVDGPIHFESGKGEVLLYPGSQVLGAVTGGKIIKKN